MNRAQLPDMPPGPPGASTAARSESPGQQSPDRPRRPLPLAFNRALRRPQGVLALGLCAGFVVMAVAAPLLAPHGPIDQDRDAVLLQPGGEYLLGTDELGRDILSRIIFGARAAVMIGVVAVFAGAVVGTVLGLLAGYYQGWLDSLTGRVWDALLAYPGMLLAIVVVAVLGPGTNQIMIAIAVVNVPVFARLARASTLREREREYVIAAECLGGRDTRIIFTHVLPNVVGPLLVQLSLAMGFGVLLEAGMSFLGLGTQPPQSSWGLMLKESRGYLREAPWYGVFPGLSLAVFLVALNLLADSLRDAMAGHRTRVW